MATVLDERLFTVQAQRVEDRPVLDREQDRRVAGRHVGVLVQGPRGEHDDVTAAPREAAAVDDRLPGAANDVVHRAAGVPVRLRPLAGAEHLDPAGHRR